MDIESDNLPKDSNAMDEEKTDKDNAPMDLELQRYSSSMGSPKLSKSLSIRNNSLIEKLFFGHLTSHYLVGENQDITQGEDSLFGPILLDPTTNYFYKSWENYFYNIVENFRDTQDKAAKWDLVRKFPDILCFQIQRARYNPERKCAEKNNQRFEFDQEIYVDRFLHQNKETVLGLKAKADALEKERVEIEAELKAISGFRENRDIVKSLEDVLHLMQVMNSQDDQAPHLPPSILQYQLETKAQISSSLNSLKTKLEDEKKILSERRTSIEGETRTLYSHIENTKYVIFSIIIHEGSADSGHFYCLVRMQDKWYKFNDFYVREMDEKEVYQIAFGYEGSVANAYCIFYMKEEMFKECPPHNFAQLGDSNEGYYEFINSDKLFNTRQANMTFNKEIYVNQIKKVNAEYITRHDFVTRHFNDRYKDWSGKVTGMRSICDFFIRKLDSKRNGKSRPQRSWRKSTPGESTNLECSCSKRPQGQKHRSERSKDHQFSYQRTSEPN